MQHDAWFFVGIFAFIFLLWIATGGPGRPLSFGGPTLSLPDALGGGTYLSLPRAGGGGGANLTLRERSSDELRSEASFGAPSPYRGHVTLRERVVKGDLEDPYDPDDEDNKERDPETEYIELSVSNRASGPITISGWTIKSETTGASAIIPDGTNLLKAGVINQTAPITLQPGDRVYIVSGRSPVGVSFRENACIGYFSIYQSSGPLLSRVCPLAEEELKEYFGPSYLKDEACVEYVEDIDRCKPVTRPSSRLSGTCRSFATTRLNYNGCVQAHSVDKGFYGSTWRIYLGRKKTLWREKHEIVKLLDAEGKTVDTFTY